MSGHTESCSLCLARELRRARAEIMRLLNRTAGELEPWMPIGVRLIYWRGRRERLEWLIRRQGKQ